jgi:hypothetical protein
MTAPLFATRTTAWASMLLWGTGGAVFGDRFPFSTVPMYAHTARVEAAVPVVFANGERARIEDYTRITGEDPSAIGYEARCRPRVGCKAYPSSMPDDLWTRVWVENHFEADPAPDDANADTLVFGYRWVRHGPEGFEVGDLDVLWVGQGIRIR